MPTEEIDRILALLIEETQFAAVRHSGRKDAFAEDCRARWRRLIGLLKQA